MIGKQSLAEAAVRNELPALETPFPGTGRKIFVDIDSEVVYKVEIEKGANDDEARNLGAIAARQLPANIKIPVWSTFVVDGPWGPETVIAMELVRGRHSGACCCAANSDDGRCVCSDQPRMSDALRDQLFDLGLRDIGLELGNIIERDGDFFLIDVDIMHMTAP